MPFPLPHGHFFVGLLPTTHHLDVRLLFYVVIFSHKGWLPSVILWVVSYRVPSYHLNTWLATISTSTSLSAIIDRSSLDWQPCGQLPFCKVLVCQPYVIMKVRLVYGLSRGFLSYMRLPFGYGGPPMLDHLGDQL